MKIITKNPSCQHFHIDNATGQCRACQEQMISQMWCKTDETIVRCPKHTQLCKSRNVRSGWWMDAP